MDSISYQGFENNVLTFPADGELEKGTPVTLSGDGEATACGGYDVPVGVVTACDGVYAAVCVKGVVQMPGDGSLAPGFARICIDAQGRATEGDEYCPLRLVLATDSVDDTVTVLL